MKTLESHDPQFVEQGRRLPDPRLEPGKFGSDMAQAVQDAEPGVQDQLSLPHILTTDGVEAGADIGRDEKVISVFTLCFGEVFQPLTV